MIQRNVHQNAEVESLFSKSAQAVVPDNSVLMSRQMTIILSR